MDGPNWPLKLKFLDEANTCKWNHIGFGNDDQPRYVGAYCTEGTKVQELFFRKLFYKREEKKIFYTSIPVNVLSKSDTSTLYVPLSLLYYVLCIAEKWLKGQIPDELRLLEKLRSISIYRNPGISQDSFPNAFKHMKNLEYLAIHFCDLKGTIPGWIGDLTALTSLVLSNNALTGTVPKSIGKLTALKQLFLDDNDLEGSIKKFANLTNIEALLLEDNRFHGSLDDLVDESGWKHIQIMDISSNNLSSTIPPSLFHLNNLTVVDLHNNELTGSLPEIKKANKAMKFLALHQNQIKGQIPDSMQHLQKLTHLDLSNNIIR